MSWYHLGKARIECTTRSWWRQRDAARPSRGRGGAATVLARVFQLSRATGRWPIRRLTDTPPSRTRRSATAATSTAKVPPSGRERAHLWTPRNDALSAHKHECVPGPLVRDSAFRPSDPPSVLTSDAVVKKPRRAALIQVSLRLALSFPSITCRTPSERERERERRRFLSITTSRFPTWSLEEAPRARDAAPISRRRPSPTLRDSLTHTFGSVIAPSLSLARPCVRTFSGMRRMRAARERTADTLTPLRVRAFPRSHIHAPAAAPRDTTWRYRRCGLVYTDTQLVARRTGTPPRERGAPPDVANTHGHAAGSLSLSFPLLASRAPARGARGTLRPLLVVRISQSCQRATEPGHTRSKERTSWPVAQIFSRAGLVHAHCARNESTHRERERKGSFLLARRPPGRSESSRAEHTEAGLALRSEPRRILDSEKPFSIQRIFLGRRTPFRCARSYLLPASTRLCVAVAAAASDRAENGHRTLAAARS